MDEIDEFFALLKRRMLEEGVSLASLRRALHTGQVVEAVIEDSEDSWTEQDRALPLDKQWRCALMGIESDAVLMGTAPSDVHLAFLAGRAAIEWFKSESSQLGLPTKSDPKVS